MAQPFVGITLDSEEPGGYSNQPWYAIRENYCSAVNRAGGLPVALPHEPEKAAAYLDRLDALLITGGHFDVGAVQRGYGFSRRYYLPAAFSRRKHGPS